MQNDLFYNEEENDGIHLPMEDADIRYYPGFIEDKAADNYYVHLRDSLVWRQDHIKMYGKEVKIPRLQAWYGDPEAVYTYSGLTMEPYSWTAPLRQLKELCEQKSRAKFNSVLANWYRDGSDSMGWHADNEPELGDRPVIASLTLGEARDFDFRHLIKGQKQRITLQHGSLLVMAGNTQKFWQHGIGKRTRALGGRINLTFRMIYPVEK